jgi:hypothetical protein
MPEQTDHYHANFFFVHVHERTSSEPAVSTNGDNGEARDRSRAFLVRVRGVYDERTLKSLEFD